MGYNIIHKKRFTAQISETIRYKMIRVPPREEKLYTSSGNYYSLGYDQGNILVPTERPYRVAPNYHFEIFLRFITLNKYTIIACTILGFVFKWAFQAASIDIPITVLVSNFLSCAFFIFSRIEYHRSRLYKMGIAVQAKVNHSGLRNIPFYGSRSLQRYVDCRAWIVEWSYRIGNQKIVRVTSCSRMPDAFPNDTFWVLVDPENPKFAIRWELFSAEALVNDGIFDSDSIISLFDDEPKVDELRS